MSSIPPPYTGEDLLRGLQIIGSRPLSSEELARANEAIAKQAQSQKYANDTVVEIQALIAAGIAIDTKFKEIEELARVSGVSSKHLAKFPAYRQEYIGLLWKSRTLAGQVKAAAGDFVGDMLEMIEADDVTAEEKKMELEGFSQIADSKGLEARSLPEPFHDLDSQLQEYAAAVSERAERKKLKEQGRIDELERRKKELEDELQVLEDGMVKPLMELLKPPSGVLVSLRSGSPQAAFNALLTAVSEGIEELQKFKTVLFTQAEHKHKLEKKLAKIREELASEQQALARLGDIASVVGLITTLRGDISAFGDRIGKFTSLYDQLKEETKIIIGFLDAGKGTSDPEFSSKIHMLRLLVPKIAAALASFSTTVN